MLPTKIAIVDDHEMLREGYRKLISEFQNIEVVLVAGSGRQLIDQLKSCSNNKMPNLILLDLEMEDMDGIETAKRLSISYPELKVAILSIFYNSSLVRHMISLKVCAYFPKTISLSQLEIGLQKIIKEGKYFTEEIYEMLRRESIDLQFKNAGSRKSDQITRREKQVLNLICKEYNSKEIGKKLHIAPRTVDAHRNNLLAKTNSKNVAGLVAYAIKNNIIESSSEDYFRRR
ncbi:MAG: hypothetical protein CL840_05590 [Crocinitomicaceae bacterium]|nr:hypothetical protein [Crocinitomicaceae bacterium]|tara:strand:+ start:15642 stop:16334 length:693 start_codon:yes stop_codon:yes gene_type:complete